MRDLFIGSYQSVVNGRLLWRLVDIILLSTEKRLVQV